MTASFTRTQREGETWIDLGNGKLLITHAERQPLTLEVDDLTLELERTFERRDLWPKHPQWARDTLSPIPRP